MAAEKISSNVSITRNPLGISLNVIVKAQLENVNCNRLKMLFGAPKRYNPRGVLVISKDLDFLVPQRQNMCFNDVESGLKLSKCRTLYTLKWTEHTTDGIIVQFDLKSAKGIIASITKNDDAWAKLRLNSLTVKGFNVTKPETQLCRQRDRNRKRGVPTGASLEGQMNLPSE